MSKIDVSKCELADCWFYIDHTPPKGQGDWCGAIHKGACKLNSTDCKDTPIERCLIKSLYEQLQQFKADNEKLCTAIRNELPEQYNKRVSDAESDIAWGILDRNATEAEFCKNVIYETRNYIAKLEQENKELRSDNSMLLAQGDADAFVISNLNFKIQELQQCLDEIIKYCNNITKNDICINCNDYETQDRCYECDYESHRSELYYKMSKYNMALDILQLIQQEKEN